MPRLPQSLWTFYPSRRLQIIRESSLDEITYCHPRDRLRAISGPRRSGRRSTASGNGNGFRPATTASSKLRPSATVRFQPLNKYSLRQLSADLQATSDRILEE